MDDKRIMIFTASIGSGHDQVAKVLVDALSAQRGVTVVSFDFMALWGTSLRELFKQGYFKMIDWVPSWYHHLYQNTMRLAEGDQVKYLLGYRYEKKISALIKEFRPTTILCTNPFPLISLASLKKKGKASVEIATLITDYTAHSIWLDDAVDYYFVGSNALKDNLINRGVLREQIYMTGIPIHPRFHQPVDPYSIYQREGLLPQMKTVLIMGGGLGMGPFEEILEQLEMVPETMQLLVVTGKNQKLQAWLHEQIKSSHHRIKIYGYIDFINELMSISQLLISKSGGVSMTEAMSRSLPIFVTAPIPGQETGNADFIEQMGIGKHIRHLDSLGNSVKKLFFDAPWEYEAMKKNCRWLMRPRALEEITEVLTKHEETVKREGTPTPW